MPEQSKRYMIETIKRQPGCAMTRQMQKTPHASATANPR
jgi:hypothetical protein